MKVFTSCLLMFYFFAAQAQTAKVSGLLVENETTVIPFAGIKLIRSADGTNFFSALTDSTGVFSVQLPLGRYNLIAKSLGHKDVIVNGILLHKDLNLGLIKMFPTEEMLKEVSVTFTRPQTENRPDRTIVNVSGSISSTGASVYEVLERSPGVSSDAKGLSLRGKHGIAVMVDGKIIPLSGDDLNAFLKGIPAGGIDKIELITSPSAKYDAAGSAGIIDIRTNKAKQKGINGGINTNLIQGRYARQNGGFILSKVSEKWNFQSQYNYQHSKLYTSVLSERQFIAQGQALDRFIQDNFFKTNANIHLGQISAGHNISKNTVLAMTGKIYFNNNTRLLDNLSSQLSPQGMFIGSVKSTGESDYKRFNPNVTATIKHTFPKGGFLNAELDFAGYSTRNLQSTYFDPLPTGATGTVANPSILLGELNGILYIYAGKIDYSLKMKNVFDNLDAGIKLSRARTDNEIIFKDSKGGQGNVSSTNNNFLYNEDIQAIYLNGNRKLGRFNYQMGLRFEQTSTTADQIIGSQQTKRKYGQFFPSFTVDYSLGKCNNLGLTINRRIDRPTFRQLNPFRYYLNENTYAIGNPDLAPRLTMNFEFTYTLNEKLTIRYIFSGIRDNAFTVLEQDDTSPEMVRMIDRNLSRTRYQGFGISAPFSLGKWYKGYGNLNVFRNRYLVNLAGSQLTESSLSWTAQSNNTFIFSPTWTAEFVFNYNGKNLDGLQISKPVWSALTALQKQLMKKTLSLKMTISDIFYTNKFSGQTTSTLYNDSFIERNDSRFVTLGLAYRFGTKPKEGRVSIDEVKQRAN